MGELAAVLRSHIIAIELERAGIPESLRNASRLCGLEIVEASAHRIREYVDLYSPGCAVVVCAPNLSGQALRIAAQLRAADRDCPVLMMTSRSAQDGVLAALRAGIFDLLDHTQPQDDIVTALRRLSYHSPDRQKHRRNGPVLLGGDRVVGNSSIMAGIRDQVARVAITDANVLITGESGTGKEMIAELIHQNSRRRSSPFVAVNCAAIPDSLLESELFGHERGAFTGAATSRDGKLQHAATGTLFLDEVGDMSLVSQAKILRAIESRVIQRLGSNVDTPVRFRVIAATNHNLEELTREKRFRSDLYFRLNVVNLELPPLRERTGDIAELSEHILRDLSKEQNEPVRRLGSDVIRRLQSHSWPGNVRELRNILESILVYSPSRSIALSDLPVQVRKILGSAKSRPDERSSILSALSSAGWNRNGAANILHCTRMTLYRKMAKYRITKPQE